ncbi:MAG: hypothetical protein LBV36_08435 [Chromatiales bacterium]|nr:hypothetical protein [Chromatiales bacterium]
MNSPALTILGAGYVGAALWRRFPAAIATRRHPAPQMLHFDLTEATSWSNIPCKGRHVVWTFPAEPLAQVQAYHDTCLKEAASLIVLGSTSAYQLDDETGTPWLAEDAPIDANLARVQGEEWLRSRGATVLRLAGLFGPGREPAGWLQRGRIKDGAKLVNLIHVDDVVATIAALLARPRPGVTINVTNGEPLSWRELATRLRQRGELPADWQLPASIPGCFGKRIAIHRLREMLPNHHFQQP